VISAPSTSVRFATRTRLWAAHAPEALATLRARVAEQRAGRFILPGSEGRPLFAGSPPRWHENPTPSGNREWLWTLNRHYHWPHFLRVAVLDHDDALRTQVLAEWLDWIAACPLPAWDNSETSLRAVFDSVTPWRTLEAGLRMELTWPVAWESFAADPALAPADRARLLASFQEHGRVLAAVPPLLWPHADHNHYLTECAGLLRVALAFPEFSDAPAWRDQAWNEIGRCLFTQFTSEGGQIEGCPHYHAVSLRTLAQAILHGREHGLALPDSWRPRLEGALAYSLHSLRPTGVNVPWGDSDATSSGPLLAALLGALALDRTDELPHLRVLAPPAAWRAAVAESLWHAPDPEAWLAQLSALPAPAAAPSRLHHDRGLGQVMLRTDWTPAAASVFFTCLTPVNNGHAHLDPAGFDYTAHGRALAVDPGRYTYHKGPDRYAFKSAAYHNTVTIDDRDPFAYRSTFDFEPQRPGRITAVTAGPGWQSAASEQHNFAPVVHRRTVILLDDSGALLVTDTFTGLAPAQTVQLWFHLDSTAVHLDAATAETRDPALANLRVLGDPALTLTAHPGRVSDLLDVARASTRLRFSDTGGPSDRTYVTRLIPRAATATTWPEIVIPKITFP
jgi:hypothetical protein